MGIPKFHIRPGNPDLLDLPWDQPISDWDHVRLVEMPAGVHRHPVVFVAYEEGVYAIKEMPLRLALKEYEVLLALEDMTHRAAEPAGLLERKWLEPDEEQAGVVVTRFVEHAFPFRHLLMGPGFGPRRGQIVDAVAGLLVELHMVGCYWGDCSLSNVLYRYDAGAIEAVMIDAETSEIHPTLTAGQRQHDIEIMMENVAGEMADIAAMNDVADPDFDLATDVTERYKALWYELTEELIISPTEGYRISERVSRIQDLGFSVHDIEIEPTAAGDVVRLKAHVGGRTYNSNKLRELTGIDASENQAKVILGDLNYYLAKNEMNTATRKSVGTFKWLTNSFEPMIARIADTWHGDDPVQGYCDFLNHRMRTAMSRQSDVGNEEAFESWVEAGFPGFDLT